ncbi:MAG: acetyl-CoA decarbonylase/synthase complex subunit gamma [Candidatus Heimdallarchaeota archaeon]
MTGTLEFYKLLPKTNCGKCGVPTCLAFAMQLTAKNINPEKCPYLPLEIKEKLLSAALPAVKHLSLGQEPPLLLGGEVVFYRHEKKFNTPTKIAIAIFDTDPPEVIKSKLKVKGIERLNESLTTDFVAIINTTAETDGSFLRVVNIVVESKHTHVLLYCEKIPLLKKAVATLGEKCCIIGPISEKNKEELLATSSLKEFGIILSSNKGLAGLATLTKECSAAGFAKLLLDCSATSARETLEQQTQARWQAVREKNPLLGYPIISFPYKFACGKIACETLIAAYMLLRFASIIVLQNNVLNHLVPLLVLRQNIFTDPQKPIQVSAKLYEFGNVSPESPVLLTTNFSLTFFTVTTDIDACGVPCYLLVVDTEGTSVLTAYAANKINEKTIAKSIANARLDEVVAHRKLIIPGFLSPLSAKIEDETGWEVLVGPMDSSEIGAFLKTKWRTKNE